MWEIIASNRRKSAFLMFIMAMLLIAAGMLIGEAVAPGAWLFGSVIAFGLWVILALTSYYSGDAIFLSAAGAQEIQRADHPTLFDIVEEMTIAAGLPKTPRVYIIDDPRPNAFATGRDPEHASVAVTAGLLNRLNRDEVQGVIAHELGHVKNRDILYVTLAAVMIGVIALIADIFLRSLWFGGGRRSSRDREGGQAQALIFIIAILFAILGPIAAQLLYFALSRRREYLADASGAAFTRYPEGLASALEKIAANPGGAKSEGEGGANRALAPMFIVNPLQGGLQASSIFSTHPPTEERIRILRAMGGASMAEYEAAYEHAKGGGLLPGSALETSRPVGVRPPWREAHPEQKEPTERERVRQVSDLFWNKQNYAFIDCSCGARLKLPPAFSGPQVRCPRCNHIHDVPQK